jgi:nucleotide-binding universal stress UspA family protein
MTSREAPSARGDPDAPYLLCFDGSEAATHAIRTAAAITGGGPALVVHVWIPPSALMFQGRHVPRSHPLASAAEEFDASAREAAERLAADGTRVASAVGFQAQPLAIEDRHGVRRAIVALAEERAVRAVIVGARGLSAVKSALLGGVSYGIVSHCRRPVLVVPPEADLQGSAQPGRCYGVL